MDVSQTQVRGRKLSAVILRAEHGPFAKLLLSFLFSVNKTVLYSLRELLRYVPLYRAFSAVDLEKECFTIATPLQLSSGETVTTGACVPCSENSSLPTSVGTHATCVTSSAASLEEDCPDIDQPCYYALNQSVTPEREVWISPTRSVRSKLEHLLIVKLQIPYSDMHGSSRYLAPRLGGSI